MENENTLTMQPGQGTPESASTVALSPPSPPNGKSYIIKDQKNASVEEKSDAASTIAGAMIICKNHGIKVDYANADGDLVLIVRNVQAIEQPNGKLAFKYVEK